MREESITKIRDETERDESLQTVKKVIQQGWPHDKANVPYLAAPYYHFRDELAVTDGLIFRGERLVIPGTMRSEIKKNMHHAGEETGRTLDNVQQSKLTCRRITFNYRPSFLLTYTLLYFLPCSSSSFSGSISSMHCVPVSRMLITLEKPLKYKTFTFFQNQIMVGP